MSFAEMKRSRKKNLTALVEESKKLNTASTNNSADERFWQPTVDKAGNGYAVIRFLPASDGDDLPWGRLFSHGFKGPQGGWFIENCPTTLGKECPACQSNNELWNSGLESDKDIVRQRKRRLHYISNILVVQDKEHPENEGKVFLFKFGKKIWDKLNESMNPDFEDETPMNPFDMWEGADFKLKIRQVEGYRNYDKSEFSTIGPIKGDDDRLEEIYKSEYSIAEFVGADNFKSHDELSNRLKTVLGGSVNSNVPKSIDEVEAETSVDFNSGPTAKPKFNKKEPEDIPSTSDDNDDLSFFEQLAED